MRNYVAVEIFVNRAIVKYLLLEFSLHMINWNKIKFFIYGSVSLFLYLIFWILPFCSFLNLAILSECQSWGNVEFTMHVWCFLLLSIKPNITSQKALVYTKWKWNILNYAIYDITIYIAYYITFLFRHWMFRTRHYEPILYTYESH